MTEHSILDDAAQARSVDYVRQAKILRSGCYYYMLSFYDKIPYADETTPVGTLPHSYHARKCSPT